MAAQPFNTSKRLPAPRALDQGIDEMWVENVADFERSGDFNLSMYERNRLFLNGGGGHLWDVSHPSGVDIESDSRAVSVGDLDEDGRPDMVVRNSGGGALKIFLNRSPGGRALVVSLKGKSSNSAGIGARLTLEVGERSLYREHFPQNSFMAQNACQTFFGLGQAEGPFRLSIVWPSGVRQVVEGLEPGRVTIEESATE